MDNESTVAETIYNNTRIYLSFVDRIRVLFGKTLHHELQIPIKHNYQPMTNSVRSTAWVDHIFPRKHRGFVNEGIAELKEDTKEGK